MKNTEAAATDTWRARLMTELSRHVGEINAIGMAELYEAVYFKSWRHRINDTKLLRELITELRDEGVPICSASASSGGGYYLAAGGSELTNYLRRNEIRALKILQRNSRIKRISLREYWGQMGLRMEGSDAKDLA